ncbi:general substrate transporter [Mycena olivaceomarginata]|nr:general substrate transporter [Mycena olivaceomarginata]
MEFEPRPQIQFQVSNSRVSRVRPFKRLRIPVYVWPTLFTAFGGFLWGFDTGSIGPITVMPQFENQFGSVSATVQGLLVSSIIATAALSSLFSGALSDRISRTYTISLGAFVFSVGCTIACSATALPQLFIGRCIAGLHTVYVMEISPASKRGRTMTTVQLFNTVGVASAFPGACPWVFRPSSPFCSPLGPRSFLTLRIGLLSVGRPADAEAATLALGLQLTEIRKEDEAGGPAVKGLWAKDVRSARSSACGIDAVLYGPRRTQMIAGGSVIAGSMLVMGSLWAIVIRVIASEVQPKRTRAAATSLAQRSNWIIAFSTPLFLTRSTSGPYLMFGGFSLLTVLVCVVFQPETKGLSLDMLEQDFKETKLQSAVKRYFGSKSGQSTAIELPSMST